MIQWAEPRPRADQVRNEYWDVVPVPFYPPDLPDIHWEYLTAQQRAYVRVEQMRLMFPVAAA